MRVQEVMGVVSVADFECAAEWYERLFGRPADATPMGGLAEWHVEEAGGIQLLRDAERAGGSLITLLVDDLDAERERLERRGLTLGAALAGDIARCAQITDPEGNQLTFAEPIAEHAASPTPVRREVRGLRAGADDARAIRALLREHAQAVRARDAAAALAVYTDDAVCFELAPPLRANPDRTQSRKALEEWFGTWRGPIDSELRDLHIEIDGNLAFSHALEHLTGTKLDGEAVDVWYRATNGLRKERGVWKIAHTHHSVPFYMDGSLRAAVDLVP
jgi:ketosteroid isomerase-like protein/predicted enzyme related to lactoylglutathione lyase